MKTTALFCVFVLNLVTAQDYVYYSDINMYYKHYQEPKKWNEARKICLSEKATLAMPRNEADVNVLKSIFAKHADFIYIGMHRFFSPNEYLTLKGDAIQYYYVNWDGTEPNQGNTENCLGLRRNGVVHDFLCADRLQFVCQREDEENRVVPRNPDCKSDDTEYRYSAVSAKCFKIHMNARQWPDARAVCEAEGGQLAIIRSQDEKEFLAKMFTERKYTARYTKHPNLAFIGVHELFEKGNFMTVEDENVFDIDYYNNHRLNSRPGENCAAMDKQGELHHLDCKISSFFICEQASKLLKQAPSKPQNGNQIDYSSVVYRQDYNLLNYYGAFYKVHDIKQNYSDALTTCLAEGAEMLIPQSREEIRDVFKLANVNVRKMYVGIHDIFSEGQFVTLDGKPIDEVYNVWEQGEPNDSNNSEDCVVVNRNAKYVDGNCATKEYFSCKRNANTVKQNTICETYDLDYFYKIELDRCYKFHPTPRKWHEAFKICRAEQSELVIINSEAEARMLSTEFNKYPHNSLVGNFEKGFIHAGFHQLFQNGVFVTVEGKSLLNAGYAKWSPNQPDNFQGKENCGSIFRDGTLNDCDCELRAMFVCEKKLSNPEINLDNN